LQANIAKFSPILYYFPDNVLDGVQKLWRNQNYIRLEDDQCGNCKPIYIYRWKVVAISCSNPC